MNVLIALALGPVAWSLAEYVLHRFDGHGMRGRTRFSREHLAHHADTGRFARWELKFGLAIVAVSALTGLGLLVVAPSVALSFAGSFTASWLGYEWLHRRIHTHAALSRYGEWARRHHLLHHHRAPKANMGVTSPIWDWAFGTLDRTPVVLIPARQAPTWLVDAQGEVQERWRQVYQVGGRVAGEVARRG